MATRADLLLGYRSYSGDELLAERTALRAARTTFVSQNMGNKGFTKNLQLLEDRLAAVDFVIKQNSNPTIVAPTTNYGVGLTDFSQLQR
jgi:hypothetical protein